MDTGSHSSVQGVVVRGLDGNNYNNYIILWSRRFQYSSCLLNDIPFDLRRKLTTGKLVQYDVFSGPEETESRAVNIRETLEVEANRNSDNRFEKYDNTLIFTDKFDLSSRGVVNGHVVISPLNEISLIGDVLISKFDWDAATAACQRNQCEFWIKAQIRLDPVAKRNDPHPWSVIKWSLVVDEKKPMKDAASTSQARVGLPADLPATRRTYGSYYYSGTQQRLHEVQRGYHQAALRNNVIQENSPLTGLAAVVHSAKPFEALRKDVNRFTEVLGVVVATQPMANMNVWLLLSRDLGGAANWPFLRLQQDNSHHIEIGKWYKLTIECQEGVPLTSQIVASSRLRSAEEVTEMETVLTRQIPMTWMEGQPLVALVICRAELYVENGQTYLRNPFVGTLSIPAVANKFIIFQNLQKFIVELIPHVNDGWQVARFHGVNAQLPKDHFPTDLESYILMCVRERVAPNNQETDLLSGDLDAEDERWLFTRQAVVRHYTDELPLFAIGRHQLSPSFDVPPEGTMTAERSLYQPDLQNNSNDSLFDKGDDDEPCGSDTFDLSGLVIRINSNGLILFVPLEICHRLYCPKKYIGNRQVNVGDWFKVKAQRRRPREDDQNRNLLYSHIAIKPIVALSIYEAFPMWKQRQFGGVFEFEVEAKVCASYQLDIVENFYILKTNFPLRVLVPKSRLDDVWSHNCPERRFRFWATLVDFLEIPSSGSPFVEGISLQLLDSNDIIEILPNGEVVSLGIGKSDYSIHHAVLELRPDEEELACVPEVHPLADAVSLNTSSASQDSTLPAPSPTESLEDIFAALQRIMDKPEFKNVVHSERLTREYNIVCAFLRQRRHGSF